MSFDEVTFPVSIGVNATGGPRWRTNVAAIGNGREQRNQQWVVPRHVYNVAAGIRSSADYAAVLAFFLARRGRHRGFRFRDPRDCTSSASPDAPITALDQFIGTGAGPHQLRKVYPDSLNAWTRTITKPVAGSVLISVGGVPYAATDPTFGWAVNTATGVVLFNNPAAPGLSTANIRAGFRFDVPVRFDVDDLATDYLEAGIYAGRSIDIIEIRI